MTLRQRLAALKTENGLTTDELSRRSGVPKGTLNKLLNGETRNPTIATLQRLADALNCPIELLTEQSADAPAPLKPGDIPGVYRLGDVKNADRFIPVRHRKIPLLGEIAAGQPIYADETFGTVDCESAPRCDFALRVHGDSMVGARIRNGDIVFIRRQDDVDDGQIAAVIIDDEATLKRVYHIKNGLQLLSENPDFPPMVFTLEEYGSIRILGRAVAFQSPL